MTWSLRPLVRLALLASLALCGGASLHAATPTVGEHAPEFSLKTPAGDTVKLGDLEKQGTVALVVLRGFPGYQCPYCTRQVHSFVEQAQPFADRHVRVLLVYPGPPADLDAHAKEFLTQQQAALPAGITLVIDPAYAVTNLYGLRWDAPHETAYPSTFLLDRRGTITFEKISKAHGDRVSATDLLAQVKE